MYRYISCIEKKENVSIDMGEGRKVAYIYIYREREKRIDYLQEADRWEE